MITGAIACSAPKEPRVPSDSEVVGWAATAGALRPGPENSLFLDVALASTVADGWHVYSLAQPSGGPIRMTVEVSPPYSLAGEVAGPPAVRSHDANFGIMTETYEGESTFRFVVKLPPAADPNKPVEVKVRAQACSDKVCLPARTTTLSITPKAGKI